MKNLILAAPIILLSLATEQSMAKPKKDTKFYGGDHKEFAFASGTRLDPGGHNNKRFAAYILKAGKPYTLTVSGRSQLFKLDCMIFRHEEVAAKSVKSYFSNLAK